MPSLSPRLLRRLLEPLWLGEALRLAEACPETHRARAAELHRAALTRYRAGRELRSEERSAAGLVLVREAFALAFAAVEAMRGGRDDDPPSPSAAWERLTASGDDRIPAVEVRAAAAPILAATHPLALDRLEPEAAASARGAAELTVEELLRAVDPRSPAAVRRARRVRLAALVAAALVALAAMLAPALGPRNLARGRAATASSQRPGTPAAAGLTDGVRRANYGVHTLTEDAPWVMVDLGEVRALSRVVVYHRNDGYWDELLPVELELSVDGLDFRRVAERRERFTAAHPWEVPLVESTARYVRLARASRGYIAVNELEVYGE